MSFVPGDGLGEYRIVAQLLRDQALLAETTETVLVLSPPSWSDIPDGITLLGASPVGEGAAPLFVRTPLEENRKELVVAPIPGSLNRDDWDALLAAADAGGVGRDWAPPPRRRAGLCRPLASGG